MRFTEAFTGRNGPERAHEAVAQPALSDLLKMPIALRRTRARRAARHRGRAWRQRPQKLSPASTK